MSIIEDALNQLQKMRRAATVQAPPESVLEPSFAAIRAKARRRVILSFVIGAVALVGVSWFALEWFHKSQQRLGQDIARNLAAATLPARSEIVKTPLAEPPVEPMADAAIPDSIGGKAAPADSSVAPEEPQPESAMGAPAWILEGAERLRTHGPAEALEVWAKGLETEPDDRLVMVISVYDLSGKAFAAYERLGHGAGAFVAGGRFGDRSSYYLLAAPGAEDWDTVKQLARKRLGLDHLSGSLAVSLRDRMIAGARPQPVVAASVTPRDAPAPVAPAPSPPPPSGMESRIALAQKSLAAGRYAETLSLLEPVSGAAGQARWEVYYLMGTARLGLGDLDGASQALKEGLAVNSAIAPIWVQRAVIAQQKGDDRTAMDYLREAHALAPALPEVSLNMGFSAERLGDREAAIHAYRRFLELTESRSAYLTVRRKVLDRLAALGRQ